MNPIREDDLMFQVNELLGKLGGPKRVHNVNDVDAAFFVELYEGLFSEPLPDVIRSPKTKEDLVHNVQSVIDAISLDIINTSLSHISGEAIVSGDKTALKSLVDVFTWLVEFILEKIGTDTSTEGDPDDQETLDDPDLVTPEVIDSILEKELSSSSFNNNSKNKTWDQTRSDNGSRKYDQTRSENESKLYSLCSDKTEDLIALGDSRYIKTPDEKENSKKVRINDPKDDSMGRNISERVSPPAEWSLDNDTSLVSGDLDNGQSSDKEKRNGSILKKSSDRTPPHSPDRPNLTTSLLSDGTLPSESSRVRQDTPSSIGDSVSFPEPVTVPDQRTTEFDHIGREGRRDPPSGAKNTESAGQPEHHQHITHHLYHHYDPQRDPLASSLPIRTTVKDTATSPFVPDPMSASLPAKSTNKPVKDSSTSPSDPSKRGTKPSLSSTYPPKSTYSFKRTSPKSQSVVYDNLRSLVKETAAMAQSAVETSPLRGSRDTTLNTADVTDRDLSHRLREGLRRVQYNNTSDFSSRNSSYDKSNNKGILSPQRQRKAKTTVDKAPRKVSFLTSRSTTDESQVDDILSSDTSGTRGKPRLRQSNYLNQGDDAPIDNLRPSQRPRDRDRPRKTKPARTLLDEAVEELTLPAAQAYWQKYYGAPSRRRVPTVTSDDESYHSDGMIDYGHDESDVEEDTPTRTRFDDYQTDLRSRAKQVRFDDKMDKKASGHIGYLRRKHHKEDRKARVRTEFLKDLYEGELEDYGLGMEDIMKRAKTESNKKDSEYKRKVHNAPKKKFNAGRKYASQVTAPPKKGTRGRSVQKPRSTRGRIRSSSASPTIGRPDMFPDNDILPWLIEEFPYLYLSKETLHSLWRKSSRQIEQLSKVDQEIQRKKTKAQVQVENAEKKHRILADIMKKELSHNRRMLEMDSRRKQQHQVKSAIREKRIASANTRRYYNEYQVQMRSKMLKKRFREEQIFKKLFEEGLKIQKEQVKDMRKYHRDQRAVRAKKQQDYIESMENYYKDQFGMLTEAMATEIEDRKVRSKAQDKVLDKMKKELRGKLETEIKDIQGQLYRDEDDAYWRDLDAERLKQRLRTAKYQYSM